MSDNELQLIQKQRAVYYDTFANLPVVGVSIGDLGYATDTYILYRWSGAAWQSISTYTTIPSGLIVMWHGTLANIPSGYVLCDGNNSTPNLLDRFIQSVPDALTDPSGTGGADSKTTENHLHSQPTHTHTGTTNNNTATYSVQNYVAQTCAPVAHNHTFTTAAGGNDNTGNATATITDIRPKYYEIAFIMKT